MKKITAIAALLLLAALIGGAYALSRGALPSALQPPADSQAEAPRPVAEVVAEGLEIPWDIAFLPEGGLLVSERTGHLIEIAQDGSRREIAVEGVRQGGEAGLLGIALHPHFAENRWLYVYVSSSQAGANVNRVERYRLVDGALAEKSVLIDNIPGATYHDGGRMEFGPDGLLYITTGDATRPALAQDARSLGGKILRLRDDGTVPEGNPFGTAVYSYGHRNPQGLAWDDAGRLWESEHGPTGEAGRCCHDEVNLLAPGGNYGWPTIVGDERAEGLLAPALHSGEGTWAPASLAYADGALYFGGLMGKALYKAPLDGARVASVEEYFKNEFGRIRTVRVGPDGMLYLTTSNRDGRGAVQLGDDKIIRVDPAQL